MSGPIEQSYQVDNLRVCIFPTTRDLAAAAGDTSEALKSAIAERGRARIIIGTGKSQDSFCRLPDSIAGH